MKYYNTMDGYGFPCGPVWYVLYHFLQYWFGWSGKQCYLHHVNQDEKRRQRRMKKNGG